jgi:hypothetical protein
LDTLRAQLITLQARWIVSPDEGDLIWSKKKEFK